MLSTFLHEEAPLFSTNMIGVLHRAKFYLNFKNMGIVHANVTLVNCDDLTLERKGYIGKDEIRSLDTTMMVDSGAIMLTINESLVEALGLDIIDHRPSQLADGTRIKLPVAGPVKVIFEDRFCITDALVLPDDNEPLLGAIPMEEMDLWINPARGLLTAIHPEGPLMSLK
jgi:clan AA aspartic protease